MKQLFLASLLGSTIAMCTAAMAAETDLKTLEAAAKAEGPGFASKAGGILKDIGGLAAKAVTEDVGRAGNAISEAVSPETAARAKSALSAAARMGGERERE